MAGSPKKRAKREAALKAAAAEPDNSPPTDTPPSPVEVPSQVPVVHGEILPPATQVPEPTRTALKRAMRARAQEHAEEAIAVLVGNLQNPKLDAKTRQAAANDLLAWGFGKPATEIEAGEGAQMIVIRRFGEEL